MKHNWTYKKLGEIGKISSGKSISSDYITEDFSEGLFPCYGGNGLRGYINTFLYDGFYPIIGRVGALCGNVHLAKGRFYPTEHALVMAIKGGDIPEFIVYALKSMNLNQYAKGVAQPVLSASTLSELSIPIPPLETQFRIVSKLDMLQSIIEKKKEQVKQLDNLAQSIFYDMFGDPVENEKGWEVKKMGDVAPAVEYKGKHPQIANKYWLLNLDKVEAQTGRILSIDYYDYEEIGNSVVSFDKTNVLYSKLRPYLNKVVVPMHIGYATSELVPLQPNASLLDRQYIAYMLRSKLFVDYISGKVAGAKMPRVTMSVFRDFKVPISPLALQQSFAKKIEAIERQKELINQSIAEVQTLFDSKMDEYFG